MELALEAGAEDIVAAGETWEVFTSPTAYESVLEAVKKAGLEPEESQLGKYAENSINLEGVKAQQMLKLIEALQDSDAVLNGWAGFDLSYTEIAAAARAPATAKVHVAGSGRAEKTQVAFVVARLLQLPGEGEAGDAADALAVALCHAHLSLLGAAAFCPSPAGGKAGLRS